MNLIICYTPLQVLLAEKIIKEYPNESFFGVMIYPVKNTKFEYYSTRLSQCCEKFFSLHQHTDRFNLLKEIIQLKYKFRNRYFDRVFVASINDIQIQFLLSAIKFNSFYTFDDGTANIVPSSIYHHDDPNTLIRRILNLVLNNKYSTKKLKSLSQKHFTIYDNIPNIINNTKFINLFTLINQEKEDNNDSINILLGQPVYLDKNKNILLAKKVIQQFNIDYYFPHPREQYIISDINYINTHLIFEDYIAQQSDKKKYRIYSYFSSTLLNLKNSPIDIIGLRIDTTEAAFIDSYTLLEKADIPIIDIRE